MKNKKKRKGVNNTQIRCPYCGSPAILRSADGIYRDNNKNTMLYVCKNYPECDAYVRVHTGTTIPVGSLANHELRTLRRTAHQYFDQLYLSGMMSKQDAYQWLADLLSAPLSKAHIGYLGEYYCMEKDRDISLDQKCSCWNLKMESENCGNAKKRKSLHIFRTCGQSYKYKKRD